MRSDPRDPAAVRFRFLAVRRALRTLAAGAGLATAGFAVLVRRPPDWLAATAAEGLVFAGSLAGLALAMLGLNFWYLGRPSRGAMPPAAPPAAGPGRGGVLALAACGAATAALMWSEHRHAAAWALSRERASALDRALFGQVQAPFAGVAGTLTVVIATFLAVALVRRRSA